MTCVTERELAIRENHRAFVKSWRSLASPTSAANGFLICLQPGDDSIETFPPILVFDLRNAALEIMHNAVDLP